MNDEIYEAIANKQIHKAVCLVFKLADALMTAGQFDQVDAFYESLDFEQLDSNLIVCLLVTAHWAPEHLKTIDRLRDRARERLKILAPDRYERLMK